MIERASEWETEGESQNRGHSEGGPARSPIGIRKRVSAVAAAVAIVAFSSRYPYEGISLLFRLFTSVCSCHPEHRVRARV